MLLPFNHACPKKEAYGVIVDGAGRKWKVPAQHILQAARSLTVRPGDDTCMGCGRRRNEAIARLLEIIEKVKQSCIGRTTVDRCHGVRRFRWRSSIHASTPTCIFAFGTWHDGRMIDRAAGAQHVGPR